MSSLSDFEKTVKRERELLKLMKKREQEKRKNFRKAAITLKKKVKAAKKTARALEREKTRKAKKTQREAARKTRKTQREAARKTRKMARGKKAAKITIDVSPGKTLEDYVRQSPYFKRPTPSARQRALELTVGQGMDVTPDMLQQIEEAQQRVQQRVKTDDEELEELERMIEADEAAQDYVDFMAQQQSPTLSDIEEDMMGGKRRRRRKKSKKSKKSKKKKTNKKHYRKRRR